MAKPLLKEDMSEAEDANHFVIRCRGLPWSTTKDEVVNFFDDCKFKDGEESVHLTLTREGRPSGEAYIEVDSEEDMNKALEKDKAHMGKRYIEVFKSKFSEMEWVVKRSGKGDEEKGGDDTVVRLRGLPFDSTKSDIEKFFEGMEITNNGILMTSDYQGRSSGEAYVQFSSKGDAEKALEKNKQSIGHRYIEVFRSSMMEAQRAQYGGGGGFGGRSGGGYGMRGGRPGPYDRMGGAPLGRGFGAGGPGMRGRQMKGGFGGNDGGYGGGFGGGFGNRGGGGGGFGNYSEDLGFSGNGGGFGGGGGFGNGGGYGGGGGMGGGPQHIVHMRGLPFRVTENDICEWFSSVVDPTDISIIYNNQGRPTGEADVMFNSEADANKAMTKDRQNMQHRYIELFYDGAGSGGRGGGGGYGNGGGGGFGGGRGFGTGANSGNGFSAY
jgi:heterogeneous nuclear ribonucleoprotein F/H